MRTVATERLALRGGAAGARRRFLLGTPWTSVLVTLLLSLALVFAVELVARGSLASTIDFFRQPFRPGWTTVALFAVVALLLDAIIGRRHRSFLLIAPVLLLLAWIGSQKAHYLGDPLYPTDFLYIRQIVQLVPLLVAERPLVLLLGGFLAVTGVALVAAAWIFWRERFVPLTARSRLWRLALAVPALAFFASIMDYASFSWTRDRLRIIPMMWDQKENYASNGFALAFALNVPMAKVTAPAGYSAEAIAAIPAVDPIVAPAERPDIIMVMSESLWDPARLPGVAIEPDPLATTRALSSGHVFSPEFGGMTANVEFEALTGFSNAFLPYGSIPYQQYVRGPTPSLARFLGEQGYRTAALHPFAGWFWNRTNVYEALGFDRFYSEEGMPALAKRGPLPSDAALTEEIIRLSEEDETGAPLFLFAVSLQGHGPYEPARYPDATHRVTAPALSAKTAQSLLSYAEGAADADHGLKRLVEWAKGRARPTVVVFFGDHLPPLNAAYVESGFMKEPVPPRREPAADLALHRETPLVLWTSREGTVPVGTISPALLPQQLLAAAGFSHPFYTGLLGRIHERHRVIDRHVLIGADGSATPDWARAGAVDPLVAAYRLVQYDTIFGRGHGAERFFPAPSEPLIGAAEPRPGHVAFP